MKESRRTFLKVTGLAAAAGAAVGYKDTIGAATRLVDRGSSARDPVYGNAEPTEARVDAAGRVGQSGFHPRQHRLHRLYHPVRYPGEDRQRDRRSGPCRR
jgi:hypothetical protein